MSDDSDNEELNQGEVQDSNLLSVCNNSDEDSEELNHLTVPLPPGTPNREYSNVSYMIVVLVSCFLPSSDHCTDGLYRLPLRRRVRPQGLRNFGRRSDLHFGEASVVRFGVCRVRTFHRCGPPK